MASTFTITMYLAIIIALVTRVAIAAEPCM